MTDDTAVSLSDATYAVTADTGPLGEQAVLLCTSIRAQDPSADIYIFIPTASFDSLANDVHEALNRAGTIVTGDIPISEYPISALQQAFIEAAHRSDDRYLVALDTDTVLLDSITLPRPDADLYAAPAGLGTEYWTSRASMGVWAELYQQYDLDVPEQRLRSMVDSRSIPPFYNAGVVVTTDPTLPQEWLDVTQDTFAESSPAAGESFYNDQLGLALAAATRDVSLLSDRQNYLLEAHVDCPSDVDVLHYGSLRSLSRVRNQTVCDQLNRYGWTPHELSLTDWTQCGLELASCQSSRVLPYAVRDRVRRAVRRLFPASVTG